MIVRLTELKLAFSQMCSVSSVSFIVEPNSQPNSLLAFLLQREGSGTTHVVLECSIDLVASRTIL